MQTRITRGSFRVYAVSRPHLLSHQLFTQRNPRVWRCLDPCLARSMVTVGDIEQAPGALPQALWEAEHTAAVKRGDKFYEDPETGLMVMTELLHLSRGRCCGSGCRHCPYAHESVPSDRREQLDYRPVWLVSPDQAWDTDLADAVANGAEVSASQAAAPEEQPDSNRDSNARCTTTDPPAPPIVVLFWSTGKDSFLALRALQRVTAGAATPMDPPVNVCLFSVVCLANGQHTAGSKHVHTCNRLPFSHYICHPESSIGACLVRSSAVVLGSYLPSPAPAAITSTCCIMPAARNAQAAATHHLIF
eukprot:jgi/Ulvmu1/8849/UM049_0031.1